LIAPNGVEYPSMEEIKILTQDLKKLQKELKDTIRDAKTGKTLEYAAQSCKHIVQSNSGLLNSGRYWISPENYDDSAFIGYCDMATLDGGWTLVYRYSIQDLKSGNSTIFPVPDWLKDDKDDNTKISKKAPQGPHENGAVDFKLWRLIGKEMLIKSNIKDWIYCRPDDETNEIFPEPHTYSGIITFKMKCQVVGDRSSKGCQKSGPDTLVWTVAGPTLYSVFKEQKTVIFRRTHPSIYHQWTAKLLPQWLQEPCGSAKLKHLKHIKNPYGAIYLR